MYHSLSLAWPSDIDMFVMNRIWQPTKAHGSVQYNRLVASQARSKVSDVVQDTANEQNDCKV